MSKAIVKETMEAMKAKNAVDIAEGTVVNKTVKRKEALKNLAETKKNGGSKRKPPAKRLVVSSDDDEESDLHGEYIKLQVDGESGTNNIKTRKKKKLKKISSAIPREIVFANSKKKGVDVNCSCTPASLTASYENGAIFCACFGVNLWQMRTHADGVDRYTMTLHALSVDTVKQN